MAFINKARNNHTFIENNIINNEKLNLFDLGLLVVILSKPDNWQMLPKDLAKERHIDINEMHKSLERLQQHGYASYKDEIWTISL